MEQWSKHKTDSVFVEDNARRFSGGAAVLTPSARARPALPEWDVAAPPSHVSQRANRAGR